MKKLSLTIATILFLAGTTVINAQDNESASHNVEITIPTLAIVDVENAAGETESINLTPTLTNMEAGEKIDFSTAMDNSSWLNYTSITRGNGNGNGNVTHKIKAKITGSLPSGISLKLTVGNVSTGKGTRGTSEANDLTLTSTDQNVVTGIKSCYTGSGNNAGHQLTYKLVMEDTDDAYESLLAGEYSNITVTYTISE